MIAIVEAERKEVKEAELAELMRKKETIQTNESKIRKKYRYLY